MWFTTQGKSTATGRFKQLRLVWINRFATSIFHKDFEVLIGNWGPVLSRVISFIVDSGEKKL